MIPQDCATLYNDFADHDWTPEQWEKAMRAAYRERRRMGVPKPIVGYAEALDFHRRATMIKNHPSKMIRCVLCGVIYWRSGGHNCPLDDNKYQHQA